MAVESFYTRWRKAVRPLPREAPSAALLALKRRQRKLIQRTLAILVLTGAGGWIYSYWASAPDRALDLDASLTQAYNERGQIYLEDGDLQKSIRDCSKSIQVNPTLDAYYQRGEAYEKLGEHQKAIADFDAAISEFREAPFAYRARSVAKRN